MSEITINFSGSNTQVYIREAKNKAAELAEVAKEESEDEIQLSDSSVSNYRGLKEHSDFLDEKFQKTYQELKHTDADDEERIAQLSETMKAIDAERSKIRKFFSNPR